MMAVSTTFSTCVQHNNIVNYFPMTRYEVGDRYLPKYKFLNKSYLLVYLSTEVQINLNI